MMVVIAYDISVSSEGGQKRLRDISKVCMKYGVRVQSSVFELNVNMTEYIKVKNEIKQIINYNEDSIRFYNLGNSFIRRIEHIGKSNGIEANQLLIY